MQQELQPAMKLTVAVGGDERHAHQPLYQAVLAVLHESGIKGATLTRGVLSYGQHRRIHTLLNEVTMENLPLVIEAVDERELIAAAAGRIAELLRGRGLVQLQPTLLVRRTRAVEERSTS
jgi:PII-like signaling protein